MLQTKDSITRNTFVFSSISDPEDTGNVVFHRSVPAFKTHPITIWLHGAALSLSALSRRPGI